ncbi:hypothetical protein MTR67_002452 [Solanum verrucosum]|uniref:Uncharacterized protein n=1 Tax=Solanum verrucosum TaxID=315347 RepID=A0AAF0T5X4_SOLVR|nr:hypothetical protein MTR67_002452 [Solanum verrucosum]
MPPSTATDDRPWSGGRAVLYDSRLCARVINHGPHLRSVVPPRAVGGQRGLTPATSENGLRLIAFLGNIVSREEGFSSIASPFTDLTQKNVKFQQSEACENSFQELKP